MIPAEEIRSLREKSVRPAPMKMEQTWNGLYRVVAAAIVVVVGHCLKFLKVGFFLSQKENCLKVHL